MIRLRRWFVLISAFLMAPALQGADKPASPWTVDRTLPRSHPSVYRCRR